MTCSRDVERESRTSGAIGSARPGSVPFANARPFRSGARLALNAALVARPNTQYYSRNGAVHIHLRARFVREWERQRLTEEDLQALEEVLARAPQAAPVVRGTVGLRKVRFAPSRHTGSRGAMRVGFAYFPVKAFILVLAMFSKNESSDFTAAERAAIAEQLRQAERHLK